MAEARAGAAPITIEPEPRRMRARLGEFTVAESGRTLGLAEAGLSVVHYFPRADVAMDALQPGDRQTCCPHKGNTRYFHVDGPGGRADNAAWSYPAPYAQVAAIAGYIAFEPGRVVVEPVADA